MKWFSNRVLFFPLYFADFKLAKKWILYKAAELINIPRLIAPIPIPCQPPIKKMELSNTRIAAANVQWADL